MIRSTPEGGNPLQAFDYVRASSVDEVVSLLAQNGDQARVLSGGTDLLVALREGRRSAKLVIDVKGLAETSKVDYAPGRGAIGSTTIRPSPTPTLG
jgi:carbon-monoxide dehydrogenase medium subunit